MRKSPIFLLLSVWLISLNSCQLFHKKTPEEIQQEIMEKMINAKEGDVIEIPEGTFHFTKSLSLDAVHNIVIKGQGADKTILSWESQDEGAEGIKVTGCNKFVLKDLCIKDSKGDLIKLQECNDIELKNVKAMWSGDPREENGAYGLYPVTCKNVVIDGCEVSGASDAGVYVGQSQDILVKNCYVHHNVAGIEIENCTNADVFKNKCEMNTGGILVFDMPELPVKEGHNTRIYDNEVIDNNHRNFAPEGNVVAITPAGTGMIVLATEDVEIYNNKISNHGTVGVAVISYLFTQRPYNDSLYNPFCSGIWVHNNVIEQIGQKPDTSRDLGKLAASLFNGNPIPELIWDGIPDPTKMNAQGIMVEDEAICFSGNGNVHAAMLDAAHDFKGLTIDPDIFNCTLNSIQGASSMMK